MKNDNSQVKLMINLLSLYEEKIDKIVNKIINSDTKKGRIEEQKFLIRERNK